MLKDRKKVQLAIRAGAGGWIRSGPSPLRAEGVSGSLFSVSGKPAIQQMTNDMVRSYAHTFFRLFPPPERLSICR